LCCSNPANRIGLQCDTCKLSQLDMAAAALEEFFGLFDQHLGVDLFNEEVLSFFMPLLLNYLALVVYFLGFREPNLWTYFKSEKVCQAIFWTLMTLKVIYLLTCLVLTWKIGRRHTLLPTLYWFVYMIGFAIGYQSSVRKKQGWVKSSRVSTIQLQIKFIFNFYEINVALYLNLLLWSYFLWK